MNDERQSTKRCRPETRSLKRPRRDEVWSESDPGRAIGADNEADGEAEADDDQRNLTIPPRFERAAEIERPPLPSLPAHLT
jgi:transcription elongation GreA/GreB family factor